MTRNLQVIKDKKKDQGYEGCEQEWEAGWDGEKKSILFGWSPTNIPSFSSPISGQVTRSPQGQEQMSTLLQCL